MARIITVGAAQMGPIARAEPRRDVVGRMIALLEQAHARGCSLVVFPELALTTFFPRWMMADQAEVADLEIAFLQMLPGSLRLVLGMSGQMHLAVLADQLSFLVDEDRGVEVMTVGGELGIAERERDAVAGGLLE